MAQNEKRSGGAMTVAEAGRMGGRLVREKYGPEFYAVSYTHLTLPTKA